MSANLVSRDSSGVLLESAHDSLTEYSALRALFLSELSREATPCALGEAYLGFGLELLELGTGRHSLEWRALGDAFDAAAAVLTSDIVEREGLVSLSLAL